MKPTIIDLNSLQLPVQAESFQAVPGGYRLHGDRVSLLHPFGLTKFYRHGFHSWGLASWLDLHRRLDPPTLRGLWPQQDDPSLMEDYPYKSSGLSALQGPDGRILLLGALAPDAQVTAGPELLSGRYALSPNLKHASQPPGDRDWFLAYGEELEVFNRYASLLVEHLGKGRAKHSPRVWCSWYSLYREINEGIINQILASLTGLPFDAFQVDDGWQKSIGDWEANDKFPGGMASLAECIRAAGYLPGLWLAPLIVQPSSRLYQTHPEWVIQDEHGQPALAGDNWGGPFFGLDTTRSEVLDWLEELIRRVRSWGFGYLKLDFLYGGALAGIRQQDMPREVAYAAKVFQVGANSTDTVEVTIAQTDAATLAVDALDLAGDAAAAIEALDLAINTVSTTRSELGSLQKNSLETTINSLSIARENVMSAESTIRDADIAAETVQFTRNNILLQSGIAMLAQANQAPQAVLGLLR